MAIFCHTFESRIVTDIEKKVWKCNILADFHGRPHLSQYSVGHGTVYLEIFFTYVIKIQILLQGVDVFIIYTLHSTKFSLQLGLQLLL